MDTEVKLTTRKIFDNLRKQQPPARPRISDRINVEQMLDEFHARNSQHEKKTKAN
jgi:hypothetical protein